MLDNLITFQANQTAVADVAAQPSMLERHLQTLVERFDKYFATGFAQPANATFFGEMLPADLFPVEQRKNQTVSEQRLKDLGEIQRQTEAFGTRFVQKRHEGIELCFVDFTKYGCIDHTIAKTYQCVHHVVRRPADTFGKVDRWVDDQRPGPVVNLPDVALDAHQLGHQFDLCYPLPQFGDFFQKRRTVFATVVVVVERTDNVARGALDKFLCQLHPQRMVLLMRYLLHQQVSTVEKLARIESTAVKPEVVEYMYRNLTAAYEVKEFPIEICLAEHIDGFDVFYRNDLALSGLFMPDIGFQLDKFRLRLQGVLKISNSAPVAYLVVTPKHQRVLFPAKPAGVENVVVSGHVSRLESDFLEEGPFLDVPDLF